VNLVRKGREALLAEVWLPEAGARESLVLLGPSISLLWVRSASELRDRRSRLRKGARLDGVEGYSTAQELVSLVVALMMALARGQMTRQLGVRSESFHVRS